MDAPFLLLVRVRLRYIFVKRERERERERENFWPDCPIQEMRQQALFFVAWSPMRVNELPLATP